ncbi:MAG: hypothetical protein L6W00_14055 [Lentisphaeria bacterium]|nr:MAG: hypothetical protein L6W00_14055 [Lentisphaeria bacterium]
MSKIEITLLAAAFLCTAAWGNEIRFEDGFESGLKEWHIPGSRAAVTITGTAATGRKAAEIRFDPKRNPEKRHCGVLRSRKIPVSRGLYRVTGKIQLAEGYGATVGIGILRCEKSQNRRQRISLRQCSGIDICMARCRFQRAAYSDDTSYAILKLYIPYRVKQTVRLDDIRLEVLPVVSEPPPWKPQYKIRPSEKAKLTAADFPGPDGIVYRTSPMPGPGKRY